jgi:hypothetical protein
MELASGFRELPVVLPELRLAPPLLLLPPTPLPVFSPVLVTVLVTVPVTDVVPAGVLVSLPGFVENDLFKDPSAFFRLNEHPAARRSATILKTRTAETRARIKNPEEEMLK